jgi:hypothetical protein
MMKNKAFWVMVTVLESFFLILLLCEMSLVEVNLCVSKDFTTSFDCGSLSKTNHVSMDDKKVKVLFFKSNTSLAMFHTLLFLRSQYTTHTQFHCNNILNPFQ